MIEQKPMQVDEFIAVMMANKTVYPEFATASPETQFLMANINTRTGTAISYFEDGKLVGMGGIRYLGLGEAWMITPPEIREHRGLSLFKAAKFNFEKQRDELKLWRVFAETKISDNFLKHLDFVKLDRGFVWNRTL